VTGLPITFTTNVTADRPPNNFYYKRNCDRVRMEHPCFSSIEVRKKCDEEWKALGSVYRKLYEDMSAEDKTRHTKEMGAEPNSETTEKKEKEMGVNLVDPIEDGPIGLSHENVQQTECSCLNR
jgi:hypothetical protein